MILASDTSFLTDGSRTNGDRVGLDYVVLDLVHGIHKGKYMIEEGGDGNGSGSGSQLVSNKDWMKALEVSAGVKVAGVKGKVDQVECLTRNLLKEYVEDKLIFPP